MPYYSVRKFVPTKWNWKERPKEVLRIHKPLENWTTKYAKKLKERLVEKYGEGIYQIILIGTGPFETICIWKLSKGIFGGIKTESIEGQKYGN